LGVTYSKSGRWREAIDSLKDAVRLDPKDAEAWSNLGGAYRRAGMARGPSDFDRESLVQSRECYARAHGINRFDLYAALNVSRLDLLLSKWDETRRQAAKEGFAKQVHLCRFMAGEAPGDFWRRFDLAEALLFSGEREAALETFDEAVALVPGEARADNLASVLGPLENYVSAGVLDEDLSGAVNAIIAKLKIARNPA
jgi:tetratricopeptide (TPR) repeat protein